MKNKSIMALQKCTKQINKQKATEIKNESTLVGANFVRPKNRGITLVALVITIIILMILVAVTVAYTLKRRIIKQSNK